MGKLLNVALASIEQSTLLEEGGRSVTYDEGQGKKDLVVMTGPLSNVYTQALNVYFAKTDVNERDVESAAVAVESAAIDTVIATALQDKLDQDSLVDILNLVSASDDIDENPNAVVFATDYANANKPEVIEAAELESERYSESNKGWVLFIGPDPRNPSKLTEQILEEDKVEEINAFNAGDQFKRATEGLYTSRGMNVVVGFENLVGWLKTRSKGN